MTAKDKIVALLKTMTHSELIMFASSLTDEIGEAGGARDYEDLLNGLSRLSKQKTK